MVELGASLLHAVLHLEIYVMDITTVEMVLMKRTVVGANNISGNFCIICQTYY